jgi:hypothetical protein
MDKDTAKEIGCVLVDSVGFPWKLKRLMKKWNLQLAMGYCTDLKMTLATVKYPLDRETHGMYIVIPYHMYSNNQRYSETF